MSEIQKKTIKKLCINRSDWEPVKFGDVAIQQKKSVDRGTTGITKYVKGEHMYSEDLHLREWGELKDEYLGPAFIRFFDEGDILYGSRRTYLRKVTIAPFDGITSNTTFVIKANEKEIDKRLLPFVMLSEGFAEHSIKNSKGSVNPYVNWKDLADYEFLLPPKEQQAELAELLWVMDKVIEKDLAVLESVKTLLTLEMLQIKNKYFKKKIITSEEKFMEGKLEDFFVLQRGFDLTKEKSLAGDIPVISSSGLSYYHNVAMCQSPGVITGRKGKIGDVYFTALHYWPHDTTLWVKDFKDNNPKFIYWFLKSINLETFNAATAVPTLNRNTIHPLNIYFPLSEKQTFLANLLDILDNVIDQIRIHIANSKALQKSLINEVF